MLMQKDLKKVQKKTDKIRIYSRRNHLIISESINNKTENCSVFNRQPRCLVICKVTRLHGYKVTSPHRGTQGPKGSSIVKLATPSIKPSPL